MLKRLLLLAGLLFAAPAFAAGTVPGFSLTPQFDTLGKVAPGCKLYIIQAGTTSTPQTAYQDTALTIPAVGGSTLTCDSTGRLPQWFVADGTIKLRLTDKNGAQLFVGDNLLVVGPSSGGGGGGGSVDPTTIAATGDLKVAYGTSVLSGWVRANGRTIGSASSGATERANADCQALFQYLWGADANLAVSGGRGASAAADWAANKTIALPDARTRALAGLGDMGNSDSGGFSGVTFTSGNSTTLGSLLGAARRSLLATNIPAISSTNPSQSITVSTTAHIPFAATNYSNAALTNSPGSVNVPFSASSSGDLQSLSSNNSISVTSVGTNGTAFDAVSPLLLATIYLKL